MKLYAKGHLALSLDFNNNFTTITLDNENLLKLQDAIGFYYFKEDFNNFLELAHESACIADCSEHDAIKKFWKLYKDAQDMNIAEWDTFSNIYEAAKSIDGFLVDVFSLRLRRIWRASRSRWLRQCILRLLQRKLHGLLRLLRLQIRPRGEALLCGRR